ENAGGLVHTWIEYHEPARARWRAVRNTSISSGRPLMKSRRRGPSAVSLTVPGIALFVRYQPAGSTTAFAGRPKERSHTSTPSSSRYRALSVYVSYIRSRTDPFGLTGAK